MLLKIRRTIDLFDNIAKMDIRNMNLKYLRKMNVPYFHESCNLREAPMTMIDLLVFHRKNQLHKFEEIAKFYSHTKGKKLPERIKLSRTKAI